MCIKVVIFVERAIQEDTGGNNHVVGDFKAVKNAINKLVDLM